MEPKMQPFIGTKVILAIPMSEKTFRELKGQGWGEQEDSEGYMVQYAGKDNYQSWSPKSVFEEAYRKVSSEEIEIINN
ncbi:MAG TPA: hypothetical protein VMX17_04150 [Candidatus Glassbacteria bacterium]|nr:hypothetical protein [Candidatus Glassbacteria bacterium]